MKLYVIDTGFFKLDGGAMYGVVPKSIWNKLNPADENNLCDWALRCLLIEDDDRLILVDCGNGDKQDEKFFSHYYLHGTQSLDTALAKHGFGSDDITDVFLTHLHFDHCGGAIKRVDGKLVTAFKNAIYWSNKPHWDSAVRPNDREKASFLKENILPIQESGQLQFVEHPLWGAVKDEAKEWTSFAYSTRISASSFTENMTVRFVDGHTHAMMLPQINYNGKTIVYMADLLPSVGHIPIPYVMAYDMFPLSTLQEKKMFLEEAVDNNYILFFEHDPLYECCTLQRTEKGIRLKSTFKLSEL